MPVVVEGVVGFRKALKKYEPELKKELDKQIRAALKPIIADARAHVPAQVFGGNNNWANDPTQAFPIYNPSLIRKGLTYSLGAKRSRSGFVSLATLFNKNPAGGIIETAGRVHPYGRPTSHMVTIDKRFSRRQISVRTSKDSLSNNPNAGMMMIERLNEHVGHLRTYKPGDRKTRGRLLYAAYDRNQGKALDAIMKALETTRVKFYENMKQSKWELAA
jgi:hypothetical protein